MRNMMETNQKMAPATAPATITNNNVSGGISQFLKTPKGRLAHIEFLVILTAFLLLLLVGFGSCRCRCSGGKFRFVIFTAYTLSSYVITYALGLMNEAPFRNELFPVWGVFVMIILGSADSLSAYSLEDNEQWKRYHWQLTIKSFWLGFLIDSYTSNKSSTMISIYCLFFILIFKTDERARALMAASQHSLERNTKVIADYMRAEHEKWGVSGGEVDPVCMRGSNYLVRGEEERSSKRRVQEAAQAPDYRTPLDNEDQIITVEMWQAMVMGNVSSEGR